MSDGSFGPFVIERDHAVYPGVAYVVRHKQSGDPVVWSFRRKADAISLARTLCGARLNWCFKDRARMPARTKQRGEVLFKRWYDRRGFKARVNGVYSRKAEAK